MGSEEPMDVDTTADFDKFDDLLEEGEYIEPNHITRKPLSSVISVPVLPENKLENKAGTFVTGVDIFSKDVKEKIEERAKRFGTTKEAIVEEAETLYESFGIDEDSENAKNYRLNVLHMRGTENLSTKDIFKYFEDYAPASIEWINDISCNVVWLDKESAARAILGLSKKIVGVNKQGTKRCHSDEDSDNDSEDDPVVNGKTREPNTIHVKDIRCPLPPGIWRKGQSYKDSRNVFLRFATRSDRKLSQPEKLGLKGILTSSRKRTLKQIKEPSPPPIKSEPGTNGIAAKNPWGSLSKNWGVTDFVEDDYLPKVPVEPISNVKERLGFKAPIRETREMRVEPVAQKKMNVIELSDEESEAESSSEEENWCKRRKIPRMRMHADDEEEKIQKRKGKIRQLVSENIQIAGNDLRGRLVARRRIPKPIIHEEIQVVVTNPKALRGASNFRNVNVTEDEDEDEEDDVDVVVEQNDDDDEEEEGEIVDDSASDDKVEYIEEDEEEEDVKNTESESESTSNDDSSDESASEKEIQGPKGSVIKVVQHKPKPRLQSTVSTVWSRLNHSKSNTSRNSSRDRYTKTDLRHSLNKNDLRSRIGNHHMRGRSPLRIELKNDKYAGRVESDSE